MEQTNGPAGGRTTVIFVGAFKKPGHHNVNGGLMYACSTLIESELSQQFNWIKIDSTARTNRHRPLLERLSGAILRIAKFALALFPLTVWRSDTPKDHRKIALIFTSSGLGFYEKGFMARLAKWAGCQVILAPRSGLIKNDVLASDRFRAYLQKTIGAADVLICQSKSWQQYYSHQLPTGAKTELTVISNWLDLSSYEPPIRKINSGANEPLHVLFIGWVTKNKGVFDLYEAAKLINPAIATFFIAGDGDAMEELKQLCTTEGHDQHFRLLGWQDHEQKMTLLRSANLFILPSYREGYPNALLEAMAMGIPVIGSKAGAIPDIIEAGINGYLVDAGAPEQLVSAIEELANAPELLLQMGERSRKIVETNNDLDRAMEAFKSILSQEL